MAATVHNLLSYPPPSRSSSGIYAGHIPPTWPCKPLKESQALDSAIESGDLVAVQAIISEFRKCHPQYPLGMLSSALTTAVLNIQPVVLSFLLSVGIPTAGLSTSAAIEVGSAAIFEIYIANGWDINTPKSRVNPPALAFFFHDVELTLWLLDHGADPNARCDWDITPLSFAAARAPLSVIKLFLEKGGDVRRGQILHHAVEQDDQEVLALFIQRGAPINEIQYQSDPVSWIENDMIGMGTPLHNAVKYGKQHAVTCLLQNGADHTILDSKGRTALDIAKRNGSSEIAMLLEQALCNNKSQKEHATC